MNKDKKSPVHDASVFSPQHTALSRCSRPLEARASWLRKALDQWGNLNLKPSNGVPKYGSISCSLYQKQPPWCAYIKARLRYHFCKKAKPLYCQSVRKSFCRHVPVILSSSLTSVAVSPSLQCALTDDSTRRNILAGINCTSEVSNRKRIPFHWSV